MVLVQYKVLFESGQENGHIELDEYVRLPSGVSFCT